MALTARRALLRDARAGAGGGSLPPADAVPARPRPHRAREGVPPPNAQDAGLRRSGRRPLPHPSHAHARDHRDLARSRAGAAPERGSRRGDRPRSRSRAPALRPRRRGGTRRAFAGSLQATVPPQRALLARGRRARARRTGVEPDRRGARRDPQPHRPARAGHARGQIVRLVDRVAYINHDIDDAVRAGVLDPRDLPRDEIELLGPTGSRRIDALVHDLVETSERAGDIRQSDEIGAATLALRSFMFDRVYLGDGARAEHARAHATVTRIFDHLIDRGNPLDEVVDYVAGMTDRFALSYAESL